MPAIILAEHGDAEFARLAELGAGAGRVALFFPNTRCEYFNEIAPPIQYADNSARSCTLYKK